MGNVQRLPRVIALPNTLTTSTTRPTVGPGETWVRFSNLAPLLSPNDPRPVPLPGNWRNDVWIRLTGNDIQEIEQTGSVTEISLAPNRAVTPQTQLQGGTVRVTVPPGYVWYAIVRGAAASGPAGAALALPNEDVLRSTQTQLTATQNVWANDQYWTDNQGVRRQWRNNY